MARHGRTKRISRFLCGSSLALLLAWGCGDSTEDKIRAAQLAEGCVINSDCRNPYVCAFTLCHIACTEDRDCEGEQRCVKSSVEDLYVCQLPEEIDCEQDKDCPGDQVCGVDAECRDACKSNQDCTLNQVCAPSGECASSLADKDLLDAAGNILRDRFGNSGGGTGGRHGGVGGADANGGAQGGSAGAQDAGGAFDSGGAAGSLSKGGNGGSQGGTKGGLGGTLAGGAQGSSGDSSDAGAAMGGIGTVAGGAGGDGNNDVGTGGSSGDSGFGYYETSDGVELVENNDRDHTIPLPSTASIYLGSGDQDWFSVQAPDDGRAHVIELTLTQEIGARATVEALSAVDYALLGNGATLASGVTASVYASVGPGSTTLINVATYSSGMGRADLAFRLIPEADAFEPNDTRESATPIALGTEVTAQVMHKFVSATDRSSDDWYQVDLLAGTATLDVLNLPSQGRVTMTWIDARGASRGSRTFLVDVTDVVTATIPEAGTYFVHVVAYAGTLPPFASGAKPGYMAESYTFRVDQ